MSYNITNQTDTRLKKRYPNIDNIQTINYNNLNPEIIPYIATDEIKSKFTQYGQNESFYELDYETMEKAIATGSKAALEAQQKGFDNYSFNDDKYIYDFEIIDKSRNTFGITNVELIDENVRSEVDERIKKQNNGLSDTNTEYEQRELAPNSKSFRNGETTHGISTIPTKEQGKISNQSANQKITRNNQKELDNSSFSLDEDVLNMMIFMNNVHTYIDYKYIVNEINKLKYLNLKMCILLVYYGHNFR